MKEVSWGGLTPLRSPPGEAENGHQQNASHMNKCLSSTLCAAALTSALFLMPAAPPVAGSATDPVAEMLAVSGVVPVKDAGPYVRVGSYRVHVWAMLGRPSSILPDGTWLYKGFSAKGSAARGTLVVRFNSGQVIQLSLIPPAVAMAMVDASVPKGGSATIAQR